MAGGKEVGVGGGEWKSPCIGECDGVTPTEPASLTSLPSPDASGFPELTLPDKEKLLADGSMLGLCATLILSSSTRSVVVKPDIVA